MRVCYFGIYDPEYSRNRIFIKGLRQNGVEVIECRSAKKGVAKYFDLAGKHWKIRNDYDAMIVGFPGQQTMILARLLTRKPIAFNVLVSLYDSLVFDRKTVGRWSPGALYFWFIDWLSCRCATHIILDTESYIDYFVSTFHISKKKFSRIFIGSDDDSVAPLDGGLRETFTVHFHGYFNPLQGISVVLYAAKIVEKDGIQFNIIGKGQGYETYRRLAEDLALPHVHFLEPVPYDELKEKMREADICLGIFGDTSKARRVIPNKVFEALAARKAIITAGTKAAEELLTHKENVLFSGVGSPEDLAAKILELKNNPELREKISENGYTLFKNKLTPRILGKEIIYILRMMQKHNHERHSMQ